MSTEDQKASTVTLCKGVDTTKFMEDMAKAGYELHDENVPSLRNFDYVLSPTQINTLKSDSRIVDIRYGTQEENGIKLLPSALRAPFDFKKDGTLSGGNWGLPACIDNTDLWSGVAGTLNNYRAPFTLTGANVDVVVQDSGIQTDHPEWKDTPREGNVVGGSSFGTTRYQTVDWPTISGQQAFYTQDANFHRDLNGHGTHVASIIAGKLYGWANEAKIYSLKLKNLSDATGFETNHSLTMLRHWHNSKSGSRPTICNMSWTTVSTYANISGGVHRGSNFSGNKGDVANGSLQQYGIVPITADGSGDYFVPIRDASIDADIEDCIDAGVIMVGAAGDYRMRMDVFGGADYDNYFNYTDINGVAQTRRYHRGGTPGATNDVICVGAIGASYNSGKENIWENGNRGPRIDVFAPGQYIMGALSTSHSSDNAAGNSNYPLDSNTFKSNGFTGSSFAAAQVTGLLACLLQIRQNFTQAECLQFLKDNAQNNRLQDDTSGTPANDYANGTALHGAANRFLKQPFNGSIAFGFR